MTLDDLIAKLQALRVDDAAGKLPVGKAHPDSGWCSDIDAVTMEVGEMGSPSDTQRHIRLD